MKNLFLFFSLFLSLSVLGQNYDLVIPNKVNYFKDFKNEIHSFKALSSYAIGLDTVYSSFERVRQFVSCNPYWEAPIFGKAIIKKANNEWQIINAENDTIFIKTNVGVNDTWVSFNNLQNEYIEARFVSESYDNITEAIQDSIRTISFTLKDSISNNTLLSPINNLELKISKNNGIVSMPDFALFPFIEIDTSFSIEDKFQEPNAYNQLNLESILNTNEIRPDLLKSNYYSFNVGDIFQTKYEFEHSGDDYNLGEEIIREYQVISKEILQSSIKYTFSIILKTYRTDHASYGFTEFDDETLEIEVENDVYLFSGNFFETDLSIQMKNYVLNKTAKDRLFLYRYYDYVINVQSPYLCFKRIEYSYYIQGAYGLFWDYHSWSEESIHGGEVSSMKLIYYKNDSTEWGNYIDIVPPLIIEPESPSGIFIYPNPNNGSFTLFMEDYFDIIRVIITDASGREYYNERAYNEMDIIDLNLADGVYYLSINNGTMKDRKKFVVKN